jgi:hypothetical protein
MASSASKNAKIQTQAMNNPESSEEEEEQVVAVIIYEPYLRRSIFN